MTVILGRLCTVCHRRGTLVSARVIAKNAVGLEWYECEGHGAGDHAKAFDTGLLRISVETAEAYFERVFGRKD